MEDSEASRNRFLRKTKSQLIDEITSLLGRVAELENAVAENTRKVEVRGSASEVQLREALENISEGLVCYDADKRLIICNTAYRDIYGYSEDDTAPGTRFEDLVRLDVERGYVVDDGNYEQERTAFRNQPDGTHVIQLKDGRWLQVRERTTESGTISIQTDITERKEAEEELAAKEAQLRAALDNMPGGMFMVDENLVIQVFNEQYKEMYDFPDETVREGVSLAEAVRARAERGDYGPGAVEELVEQRVRGYIERMTLRHEEELPNGRVIELLRTPVEGGGVVGIATDITERKRAEEELASKEARLNAVVENVPGGVFLLDENLNYLLTNHLYREIFGIPDGLADPGKPIEGVIRHLAPRSTYGEGKVDEIVEQRLAQIRQEIPAPVEVTVADQVYLMTYGRMLGGERVGIVIDITERKQAETALRESEATFKAVIDQLPLSITLKDMEDRRKLTNRNFDEWFTREDQDPLQGTNFDIYPKATAEELLDQDAQIKRTGESITKEMLQTFPDGSLHTLLMTKFPVRDENDTIIFIAAVDTDITERKQAEETLRASEATLKAAQRLAMIGDWRWSVERDELVSCSEEYARIHGVGVDEIDALMKNQMERVIHPDDRDCVEAEFNRFDEEGIDYEIEYRIVRPDGECRHVLEISEAIRDASGRTIEQVVTVQDITERKQVEEALAAKEAQLRMALENMPGAMVVVDSDLRITAVNDSYREFFGDPDGLVSVGASMRDILKSEMDRALLGGSGSPEEILEERVKSLRSENMVTFEDRSPDGRYLQLSRTPAPNRHTVTVAVDITARKKIENALAESHSLITSSIEYASRIQRSVLTSEDNLKEYFSDSMVIWQPRDVVGGDLYWIRPEKSGCMLAVLDCTGHGVPGALMTTIAVSALDNAFRDTGDPARLIARVNQSVKQALQQDGKFGEADDGLELGVCLVENERKRLTFAGARFELMISRGTEIESIKGDKSGVGYRHVGMDQKFTNHSIRIRPGMSFYMTTDGMVDQIGGNKRRAFGKRRIMEILAEHTSRPMAEQREHMLTAFDAYQGAELRRDDVTLFGFAPIG